MFPQMGMLMAQQNQSRIPFYQNQPVYLPMSHYWPHTQMADRPLILHRKSNLDQRILLWCSLTMILMFSKNDYKPSVLRTSLSPPYSTHESDLHSLRTT